jgi:putative spermidine/putrescine transport system substrate-binding protein
MTHLHPRRRLLAAAGRLPAALGLAAGMSATPARAAPFTLRFLDTTETARGATIFQNFAAARPDLLEGVQARRDHVEALFGPIRAAVEAGQPPYDVVLTNLDGAMMGAELGLWQPMSRLVQPFLPPMDEMLTPLARLLRGAVREQAQIITVSPGGPLLAHAPERLPRAPRTAEELLAWARENPGRFLYPRPEFSEAGRCFVAGLPWMLGDQDPLDPADGWPATWEYLAELDRHVPYYPTTTAAAMQELTEGGVDLVATTIGMDIMLRGTGVLPPNTALAPMADLHWIPVGLFVAVLRGLSEVRLQAIAEAIATLLEVPFQRTAYARGLYWPGPVREDVALEQNPFILVRIRRR